MTFLEHLDELRKRILHSVVGIVVAFCICWTLREEIFHFLAVPIADVVGGVDKLIFIKPTEPFSIWLKVSFVASIFLTSPFILLQVWLFIAPGLYRKEKNYAIPFLVSSTALFVFGGAFAYYVILKVTDAGCTFRAIRRTALSEVPVFNGMHRFLPTILRIQGFRITEIPVNHEPRRRGRSKYGLERAFKVLLDLIVVKFLTNYFTKPIYVFGGFGMLNICLAALAMAAAVAFKLVPPDNPWGPAWHKDFVETPLPVAAVGLLLLGIQMVLIGLLAEMIMRTYFESQGKRPYMIASIQGAGRSSAVRCAG